MKEQGQQEGPEQTATGTTQASPTSPQSIEVKLAGAHIHPDVFNGFWHGDKYIPRQRL